MIDTRQYVLKQIEERDIRFIRLWFTDMLGNLKSFAITPSDVDSAFQEGISFDGTSIEGIVHGAQNSDMLVVPDASTFQVLPWRPSNNAVASMFCSIRTPDGDPSPGDSRQVLMRMLRKAQDMGFIMDVGTELEYFYFKDATAPVPIDDGGYFDLTPLDNASDLRRETILMLEQMGIPVERSLHENAPSQHEIDLHYSDAMTAADAVMTSRLVVKEVACMHGVHASFMPKPLENENGSAMFIHESLLTDEGNAFFDLNDPDGYGLSPLAKHYIAGVLKYAPEYMLITNQYVNSYKRLVSGFDAPTYAAWGNKNRSAFVRVPRSKPRKEMSARVEIRNVDSAANPYLAIAATLAAGLKGIEEELVLQPPVEGNRLTLTPEEYATLDAVALPGDLSRAVDAFEQSELMHDVLGDYLHRALADAKRREWEDYQRHVSSWELKRYLAKL
ncbi:glutamine synthetase family protein [Slackia heliotrinireducens]|uniref:L-glutamine synthetase n=1 Tax=Slackia heliotrinireducens (strain ATCC 29202 / DSM 20476 / NCTC 11029 / RHS 1) TaxID=471855 RepID=C7N7W7_SLAHD|nr:glutamine synthetase family protein [Slackia heliotrinireducens]ACV23002.1 L-glutamine synthetase [Slackia heliotrinireducens DSM 20476]VEH01897.1 Probable glutamine synthetase 2 [Slackia heliotrinireducens]